MFRDSTYSLFDGERRQSGGNDRVTRVPGVPGQRGVRKPWRGVVACERDPGFRHDWSRFTGWDRRGNSPAGSPSCGVSRGGRFVEATRPPARLVGDSATTKVVD